MTNNKPIFHFAFSRAIFLVVGLALIGGGIFVLVQQQSNPLFGGSLILLGVYLSFVGLQSTTEVFRGKTVFEQVLSLPLPGVAICEISMPTEMKKGKVVLFFENTTERYSGKITLNKIPADNSFPTSVILPVLKPFRIKVPKWSPTSDAGAMIENWPRRTGQLTDPIVLRFSFPIKSQEKLKLEFELESNFKGTKLERRFPITGKETIRIFVKE